MRTAATSFLASRLSCPAAFLTLDSSVRTVFLALATSDFTVLRAAATSFLAVRLTCVAVFLALRSSSVTAFFTLPASVLRVLRARETSFLTVLLTLLAAFLAVARVLPRSCLRLRAVLLTAFLAEALLVADGRDGLAAAFLAAFFAGFLTALLAFWVMRLPSSMQCAAVAGQVRDMRVLQRMTNEDVCGGAGPARRRGRRGSAGWHAPADAAGRGWRRDAGASRADACGSASM